jgi:hypothetical protein
LKWTISLQNANHQFSGFWQWVSWGHMSEFVDGASPLGSGLLSLAFATYGRSQDLEGILSPVCGSDDPHTNFFSLPAIWFLAHGDI